MDNSQILPITFVKIKILLQLLSSVIAMVQSTRTLYETFRLSCYHWRSHNLELVLYTDNLTQSVVVSSTRPSPSIKQNCPIRGQVVRSEVISCDIFPKRHCIHVTHPMKSNCICVLIFIFLL